MIPQDIKDKVRHEILAELEAYFEEADEVEDDEVQTGTSVLDRIWDFYTYSIKSWPNERE